jgi:hypothetical protein
MMESSFNPWSKGLAPLTLGHFSPDHQFPYYLGETHLQLAVIKASPHLQCFAQAATYGKYRTLNQNWKSHRQYWITPHYLILYLS